MQTIPLHGKGNQYAYDNKYCKFKLQNIMPFFDFVFCNKNASQQEEQYEVYPPLKSCMGMGMRMNEVCIIQWNIRNIGGAQKSSNECYNK